MKKKPLPALLPWRAKSTIVRNAGGLQAGLAGRVLNDLHAYLLG